MEDLDACIQVFRTCYLNFCRDFLRADVANFSLSPMSSLRVSVFVVKSLVGPLDIIITKELSFFLITDRVFNEAEPVILIT